MPFRVSKKSHICDPEPRLSIIAHPHEDAQQEDSRAANLDMPSLWPHPHPGHAKAIGCRYHPVSGLQNARSNKFPTTCQHRRVEIFEFARKIGLYAGCPHFRRGADVLIFAGREAGLNVGDLIDLLDAGMSVGQLTDYLVAKLADRPVEN